MARHKLPIRHGVEKRVMREMAVLTRKDRMLLRQLTSRISRLYRLEHSSEAKPAQMKKIESSIAKALQEMRQDARFERGFVKILKPRTRAELAVLSIFGPFAPPPPKDVPPISLAWAVNFFRKLGFDPDHAVVERDSVEMPLMDKGRRVAAVVDIGTYGKEGPAIGDIYHAIDVGLRYHLGLRPGTPAFAHAREIYKGDLRKHMGMA